MVRYRVVASGSVQGVFFRDACRREADRLGVAGAVWNRSDGAVEVEAEGEEAAVAALIAWCRVGPPRATVTGVEIERMEVTGSTGFRITTGRPSR
jgi:acylphosphatase